jgi:hypothetical protein
MTGRSLLFLFDSAYVLALAAWVGSILFFSFGVAPLVFSELGEQTGGKFVRVLFPRYYLWGAICGAVALPAYVAGPLCFHEYRGPMVGVSALVILAGILITMYGGNSLTPAINQARDQGPAGQDRFRRLRRRAVWLNALVLAIGIGLLIAFAARPGPKTAGIVEMTPIERARYDAAVERVIEDVEAKYGMRPPRVRAPGESTDHDALIDAEAVEEIDAIFARKRQRDRARAGAQDAASPEGPSHGSIPARGARAPSGSAPRPARSGEP